VRCAFARGTDSAPCPHPAFIRVESVGQSPQIVSGDSGKHPRGRLPIGVCGRLFGPCLLSGPFAARRRARQLGACVAGDFRKAPVFGGQINSPRRLPWTVTDSSSLMWRGSTSESRGLMNMESVRPPARDTDPATFTGPTLGQVV